MANPALTDKRFEQARDDWMGGAPDAVTQGRAPTGPIRDTSAMTAGGTFAKAFVLFVVLMVGGVIGWSQSETSSVEIDIPGWTWLALLGAFALAMVCSFKPTSARLLSPIYALLEGIALGVISKAYEASWNGIVVQAILVTIAVFFVTLLLYTYEVVKVTRKFQMVVIGATFGVVLLYLFGFVMSLFGVDLTFWNEPSAFGIAVSVVIAGVAALNLFLDYEFIRQASASGAPAYMEWYGAFGITVTIVWLYIELLRLLSLLRD
jgi:uncharacterized YccA/Bax inhibitor family protein